MRRLYDRLKNKAMTQMIIKPSHFDLVEANGNIGEGFFCVPMIKFNTRSFTFKPEFWIETKVVKAHLNQVREYQQTIDRVMFITNCDYKAAVYCLKNHEIVNSFQVIGKEVIDWK